MYLTLPETSAWGLDESSCLDQISQKLSRKANSPDIVAEELRAAIITGRMKPGDRILESRIARDLALGQPTVREALVKLEHEGLVVRLPNRGCRVTALSEKHMDQIFRVRLELEPLAVQLAMQSWQPWKSERLTKALEVMRVAAKSHEPERYYRADLRFHMTLWSLAENPFLEKALAGCVIPLFATVLVRLPASQSFNYQHNEEQHEKIVRAILRGNNSNMARRITKAVIGRFWKESRRTLTPKSKGRQSTEVRPENQSK
jgi:DNA-binding GntR family transcriptional regulator